MERANKIISFLSREPLLPIEIAASIGAGNRRTITADSERLAAKFEKPKIVGAENIPNSPTPLIIACNHPNLYDLFAGGLNITYAFAQGRKEQGIPGRIRWMIAKNLESKDRFNLLDQRVIYPAINTILRRIHNSYDFIPVPINYLNPQEQRRERAASVIAAKNHLIEAPYSAIGIFPEGDFANNGQLLEFYSGIGTLCRATKTEVLVLPTNIYRTDKNKLTLAFGESLKIDPQQESGEITQSVKNGIESLYQA